MNTLEFIGTYWPEYLRGLGVGLGLAVGAMVLSLCLGTVGALGRLSTNAFLRGVAATYVAIFRGIPPLVMLFIVYFGLPELGASVGGALEQLTGPLGNRVLAACVALGVNSGAYTTEIIRAAIVSVPHEQTEAARSIGMSKALTMRRVILPQAARIAFPSLGNEFVINLKGTSLASVIGAVELMRAAQLASAATFKTMLAYSMAGLFYVIVVVLLQLGLSALDRSLAPTSGPKQRKRRPRRKRELAAQRH